jgi:hypothetical protein
MNPIFCKWTLALIQAGVVTMEAQLWAYNLGLVAMMSP